MISRLHFIAGLSWSLSVAFASPAAAQSSFAPEPSPPYIAAVPGRLHWIVTLTYTPRNPQGMPPGIPPDSPVSIDTTKVGTTRRIVVKFADGTTKQFDLIGPDCYTQLPPPLGLQALPMEGYVPFPYFDLGFSFTGCVNAPSYRDYTNYQSVPTFHYRDGSTEAWISPQTRLPIGADLMGKVKTTYQYLPTPDAIELTPEEQKSLQLQKKAAEIYRNMR